MATKIKKEYEKINFKYWQKGYFAPNVEPAIFRFYGKFIKNNFKKKIKLLDFGCGQEAAVNFFNNQKIDAYGVDISLKDINNAKKYYKSIKHKFLHINNLDSLKSKNLKKFDIITCVQSLYYLSDDDLKIYLIYLKSILKPNGILYATMISTKSSLYSNKKSKNGLSLVNRDNYNLIPPHYINFVKSYKDLKNKFKLFNILKIGYYSFCLDRHNDVNHHYVIIGKKNNAKS